LPRVGRGLGRALRAVWRLLPARRQLPPIGVHGERPPLPEIRPAPAEGIMRAPSVPIHHHEGTGKLFEGEHEPNLMPDAGAGQGTGLYSERSRFAGFELPPLTLLEDARPIALAEQEQQLRERAALLEKTFTDFGINVR